MGGKSYDEDIVVGIAATAIVELIKFELVGKNGNVKRRFNGSDYSKSQASSYDIRRQRASIEVHVRILTIGGTFNPVHVGHVRLGIEAVEALNFDFVEWVPCFAPRHKSLAGLLPFALRADLVRIAVGEFSGHIVDNIESTLPVPSYTYHTLAALVQRKPGAERYFLLGQTEFARLHKWYRGRELGSFAHIVVALRNSAELAGFQQTIEEAWPDCSITTEPTAGQPIYRLASGRTIRTLSIPWLEIRASLVRERWLARRDLRLLIPAPVLHELEARRDEVSALWKRKSGCGPNIEPSRPALP